ncbi:helix-turn-helix domain-containing protein [Pseudooceanicola sp. CBS1P-1]|uniref:Helix-turn-helix domain-containing protein n=1 Tax=Pseudooceanicola albus TaxID=2692189 RepID=A0A6L7GBX1_9RHOB|nr:MULTISPECIES: helix-turn-helix transcriptional regulator [Pseudooceanicola]MBT9386985.1 helix-turn-helix domain-containing protein [Pseudooceanicola endophyticus]MXN21202.1 helix-turn-helix domain-containing protein [Pseudooceanicola albus]
MAIEDLQAEVGRRIRALRKARDLSQRDLATLTGLAVPALSLIENGRRDVKLSTFLRLSEALRVEVSAFFVDPAAPMPPRPAPMGGYDLDEEE